MMLRRFAWALAVIAISATAGQAQTPAAKPVAPPPVTAPAKPAIPAAAPAAAAAKTNLNTATAADLDKLPQVGSARSKVIMTERAKAPFKDWADFDKRMTGTSVNAGVKSAIKDLVTF